MDAFKEGDWVRRVTHADAPGRFGEVGKLYKVLDVNVGGIVIIDGAPAASPSAFEPWTPKVGERVRYVASYETQAASKEAVVLKVSDYGDIQVRQVVNGAVHTELPSSLEPVTDSPLPVAAEAQPAAPAPLTIQAGKFYKTRDGRKVGPMVDDCSFDCVAFIEKPGDGRGWSKFGIGLGRAVGEDLIAEWVEPTTNTAATVDALDGEYGPVVAVADRDNDTVCFTVSLDTSELHEELDAVISKLKKIRKLQRELGLIVA